ncbi:MAG: response regulator [Spirochaetaceae bacterium]|nr:MAG: response regulator [Spirochaetaceae bacterium]
MKFHVLVVDDEELAVEGLRVFPWESYGFELAASSTDSRRALNWCKTHPVDVVLADVRMPGMTGLELAAALRESLPDVLVILFSGHNEFAYAQEALRQQVFRYILKPVDDEELGLALQDAAAFLQDREHRKHWTQQLARDYWFRDRLLDRRVETDTTELADLDPALVDETGYVLCVVTTDRDLASLVHTAEGVVQCTTLQTREWAVLVTAACADRFCVWLERHRLKSGVSAEHGGLAEVRQGFLEARQASDMHFLHPDQCVIRFEEIPESDEAAVARDLIQAGGLAGSIVLQDETDCFRCLHELFDGLKEHAASPEITRRAAFILAVGVQSTLRETASSLTADELSELPNLFALVDEAVSIQELVERFHSAIHRIRSVVTQVRSQERTDAQLLRALTFIDEHYHEPISLDDVAAHLSMHPSRFSVWFKKAKGVNYIDYLTRHRIDRARELLLSPETKVREVAERIGFQDPRYFGQVFKKIVGITPGRYQLQYGRHDPGIDFQHFARTFP